MSPLLLVISGPSGAGKDAVIARVREALPKAHFAVTATTRPPRPGEREGVDYHFVSDAEYDGLLAEDGFLEHADVYTHRYGVPKAGVREALSRGQDVIVRVDVQGAATIKRLVPGAVLIFLAPGSTEELEERLRARATDEGAELRVRMDTAAREMALRATFDYVVTNADGQLDDAVSQILAVVAAEKRRRRRPLHI
ncbi:MAG: guanylate kinase [Dehalococcoidia bacterium]|jgi:guanylate kinase